VGWGAVSDSSKSIVAVARVAPILFRSCSAHCPTGHKPELSDQNEPHSPPPGAWLLPPLSAWGTVPLGPALLTAPLYTSQSSPTSQVCLALTNHSEENRKSARGQVKCPSNEFVISQAFVWVQGKHCPGHYERGCGQLLPSFMPPTY